MLACEVQPAADLWPGIERRLVQRASPASAKGRRLPPGALLLAAAMLVAGIGVGWLLRAPPPAASEPPQAIAAYRAASVQLHAELLARSADFDASTLQWVRRDLALIDGAIDELERAIEKAPQAPGLRNHLLARYRQQIDLLTRWLPAASRAPGPRPRGAAS